MANIISGIKLGAKAYLQAFKLMKEKRLYWYAIIPFALMFFLYRIGYYLQNRVDVPVFDSVNSIVWYLINRMIEISIALMLMHFTKYLVVGILSPLLTYVSEKTETILTGTTTPFSLVQFIKDIKRALVILVRNFMWNYAYIIIIFIFCSIFWKDTEMSPFVFLVFFIDAYYYGFSFLDYVIERRKKTVSESILFIRKHTGLTLMIGMGFSLLLLVPVDLEIFFNYKMTVSKTIDLSIQLFWWVLASFSPIIATIAATIAMQEVDPLEMTND